MPKIKIQTNGSDEVVNITNRLNELVSESGVKSGVCFASVLHTTAALSTADLDPGTDKDMLDAFREMIPSHGKMDYRHPHNPEHTPDHILSALIGPSVALPVDQTQLTLGSWQEVVLFEFNGPRERTVVVRVLNV